MQSNFRIPMSKHSLSPQDIRGLITGAWQRLNSNMGALHSLFTALISTADTVDRDKVQELINELQFIFKGKLELTEDEIAEFIPSVDDLDFYPDFRRDESFQEFVSEIRNPEVIEIMKEWEAKHPHRSQRFVRAMSMAFNNPPMTGVLIRRSMLVSLVTFLEIFLHDIYKNHFLISGQSKSETATKSRRIMNQKWSQKIGHLKNIELALPILTKNLEEVIEYTQRRNLLVHNDGVVDETYKSKALRKYNVGDHLLVSTKYLQRAIDLVHLICFLIYFNQLDRFADNKDYLHNKLEEFIINSLNFTRYDLVLELTDNTESLNLPENRRQVLIVNKAIVFRETKRALELEETISLLEKTEHDWPIAIAISMLRNDLVTLQKQLLQAPNGPVMARIANWPLFDPIRNELWFKATFSKKARPNFKKINRRR